jgi:hypothetical protein
VIKDLLQVIQESYTEYLKESYIEYFKDNSSNRFRTLLEAKVNQYFQKASDGQESFLYSLFNELANRLKASLDDIKHKSSPYQNEEFQAIVRQLAVEITKQLNKITHEKYEEKTETLPAVQIYECNKISEYDIHAQEKQDDTQNILELSDTATHNDIKKNDIKIVEEINDPAKAVIEKIVTLAQGGVKAATKEAEQSNKEEAFVDAIMNDLQLSIKNDLNNLSSTEDDNKDKETLKKDIRKLYSFLNKEGLIKEMQDTNDKIKQFIEDRSSDKGFWGNMWNLLKACVAAVLTLGFYDNSERNQRAVVENINKNSMVKYYSNNTNLQPGDKSH